MSNDENGAVHDPDALSPDDMAAGEALFARPFTFLKSAPELEFLPPGDRVEICFAGRSNVGKSSLINALTRVGGLARTSNTPGRTQELNFFAAPTQPVYLVDMPGYGFAEAPKAMVDRWKALVRDYLRGRANLARVYVLVDSRHGLKPVDRELFDLLNTSAVSFAVVLTKADKLKTTVLAEVTEKTQEAIAKLPAAFPRIVTTSSETGLGIDVLRAEIALALKAWGAIK
ncbi:MAG: hypothetical protein RL291_820 [Pseudomonadota bacterium]